MKPTIIPAQPDKGKKFKLKAISAVVDKEPLIDAGLMELARWISDYYVCPLGMVLGAIVPGAVKKGAGEKKQKYVYLAVGPEEIDKIAGEIKGKKQKQVVQQLRNSNAFEIESAIELDELLEAVGCTDLPVKNLVEKQIIKIAQRTVLKSLPAMPEGMLIKREKVILNDDQQKALANITSRINEDKFGVTLLYRRHRQRQNRALHKGNREVNQKRQKRNRDAARNRADHPDHSAFQRKIRANSGYALRPHRPAAKYPMAQNKIRRSQRRYRRTLRRLRPADQPRPHRRR